MRKVYAFTTGTQATLAGIVTVPMVDFSEDCNGVSIHYNLTGVQFSLVFHLPCLSLKKIKSEQMTPTAANLLQHIFEEGAGKLTFLKVVGLCSFFL